MNTDAKIAHIEATHTADIQDAADQMGCEWDELAAIVVEDIEIDFPELDFEAAVAAWFERM